MDYVAELLTEAPETTSGEFRECCIRLTLNIEGKIWGGEGKTPTTTNRPESLKSVVVLRTVVNR